MQRLFRLGGIVLVAMAGELSLAAQASTIDSGDLPARPAIDLTAPIRTYPLDVEMVVQDWVVCASLPSAEQIVNARVHGAAEARKTYAELQAAKTCGAFGELKVILQKPIYASAVGAGYDARVFGALINFSGSWAAGYLVAGGLAD